VVQNRKPAPKPSSRKSLTRDAPSTDATTVLDRPNGPGRNQTGDHGQYIRLGKTVFGRPSHPAARRFASSRTRTSGQRLHPTWRKPKNVSCFCSLHDVNHQDRSPGNLLSSLPIRQPNAPEGALANLVDPAFMQPMRLSSRRDAKNVDGRRQGGEACRASLVEPIGIEPMTF
jgi:hypothetical protein